MEAQAHPMYIRYFTLAMSHTLNPVSANAQLICTSIHTHVLATLHETIANNQAKM